VLHLPVVTLLHRLHAPLAEAGLNHLGVVARARYDAAAPPELAMAHLHPGARSVIVVGSGGRVHWERFLAHVGADPESRLARCAHPLDDFCSDVFARLAPELLGCRVVFAAFHAPLRLDFLKLGELAGLGRSSELGILVGQRFGPWFGMRAAVFTPEELPDSAPEPVRLCDGCSAPCRAAAQGGMLTAAAHLRARAACVVAPGEGYDQLERIYHYDRALGRRLLCERFGVRDQVIA
jgi:hypothetical protein